MANNTLLRVDNVWIKTPSSMTVSIQDVSRSDAGRTEDALMHKNRVTRKYKIDLGWNNPTPAETASILQAFAPEYFSVQFTDPLTNSLVTKTFYSGDQTTPIRSWTLNNKRYESISFNIIER